MRCVIDANIYLSFLLKPFETESPPTRVVQAIVEGDCDLLFPDETITEIRAKVANKPYFREFVEVAAAEKLISMLSSIAVPLLVRQSSGVEVRDPNDIYLLDVAYSGVADFLVSGDKDLQALRNSVSWTSIVTSAEFLLFLDAARERGW